ncbi:hypothetical protein Nepgr_007965 [Nepenthes gracilis]|uniref:Uncharacterized protein n=1 Tax=Nepenthes gracilis TaxID=150966 RepID=A0AAD3S7Y0_NEPGR|nr:hypothetical protein Nepgr_007965 [Nepenthes gracilis]
MPSWTRGCRSGLEAEVADIAIRTLCGNVLEYCCSVEGLPGLGWESHSATEVSSDGALVLWIRCTYLMFHGHCGDISYGCSCLASYRLLLPGLVCGRWPVWVVAGWVWLKWTVMLMWLLTAPFDCRYYLWWLWPPMPIRLFLHDTFCPGAVGYLWHILSSPG